MCFRHAGKLLGFIVSNRGIEANPAKIRALSQLAMPTDLKQAQKLVGCVTAYRNAALKMSARFEGLEFHHVAGESNQAADVLARIGAKRDPVPPNIFLERHFKPSVVWQGKAAILVRIQTQP